MTKNERFKDSRLRSGKSQRELADILSVSQAYINGLENDKAFSLKKAKLIAPHIGVDAEWLYFGDNKTVELSQKSNIAQNDNINFNERNNKPNVNNWEFNDVSQLNNRLAYKTNSTFPDKPTSELWQLIDNQQQQIRNLMQQLNLVNNQVELMSKLLPKS